MTNDAPQPQAIFSLLQRAFGDARMEAHFSETATVEAWLRTEAALALSQATVGELDADVADAIAGACSIQNIDVPALWESTANVGYPILPLVRQITSSLPEAASGSVHYGATTQDIMDTGSSLQLAAAVDRLLDLVNALGDALALATAAHASTVMAGRTHGQQAVPTTLGAKLATFLRQADRLRSDLLAAKNGVCVVSLYGAAGTSAGLGADSSALRSEMARRLGLADAPGPRHVARDGQATFAAVCGRASALCARLAREVIDLSRTEIGELTESGGHHRGASSTMPQKANPIDSEAIVGMAATVTALTGSLYRAMETGHERSSGEWQIEWHVLPQVAVLSAGCLMIAARVVNGMVVDTDRMAQNLAAEKGRTMSEAYMFQLAPELGREAAHDLVYAAATESKSNEISLEDALRAPVAAAGYELKTIGPEEYTGDAVQEAQRAVEDWSASPGGR